MGVPTLWIGIDTGGTFTDFAVRDAATGAAWLHKAATTPDDPARGILAGLAACIAKAGATPGDVALLCHGTTLATNAVLERKWAKTGMIATAGFRDVIELARQRRPSFFNLDIPKPAPPTPRAARFEAEERIGSDGAVVTPLDVEAVRMAADGLKRMGCQAVAICFLHAYANPDHERRAAAIVKEAWPDAYVTQSADLLAEFREYERFATAAVNASLAPLLDRYLARFEAGAAALGVAAPLRVMQSNGGAATAGAIRRAPVNTFLSGPAGGVVAATAMARRPGGADGTGDVITFDMGGTSTDVCLIAGGEPGRRNVREMGGFPVRTATLDLHTIGAGGGSVAWVDPGGLLKVGPESAGAVPGPAGYGRGGDLATVTDANMVLGRLNQRALLDGAMPVYPEKARAAIERSLSTPLGLDLEAAAAGVLRIVNVNMMGAARVISVERGEDPRRFALMAFGGAGPLHAADVAQALGVGRVIVPANPGVLSAEGLIRADARGDFSVTCLSPATAEAAGRLQTALAGLEARAAEWLKDEGLDAGGALRERRADLRYLGQSYELAIPIVGDALDIAALERLAADFHEAHARAYGHAMAEREVEIVNLRLAVTVRRTTVADAARDAPGSSLEAALIERRPVWFPQGGFRETPVYRRAALPPGAPVAGPAILEQMDATTVVPPGATFQVDAHGDVLIDLPQTAGSAAP